MLKFSPKIRLGMLINQTRYYKRYAYKKNMYLISLIYRQRGREGYSAVFMVTM